LWPPASSREWPQPGRAKVALAIERHLDLGRRGLRWALRIGTDGYQAGADILIRLVQPHHLAQFGIDGFL
jgi:hypothetical protein